MEELIQKAKNGDKEAFTTIMLSLEKDLYKIAKTRLKMMTIYRCNTRNNY